MTVPIPGPQAYPIIGNILDIQGDIPVKALERLIDIYGPIYKLRLLKGEQTIFIGDFELFDEACDETRFFKIPPTVLTVGLRPGPRGLFAIASEKDEDWGQAHRILMPAFGPMSTEGMFDEMHDIATQMVMKWARMGPDNKILITDDFTRLTLDTIALCAMDYRFNSFYIDGVHPFVQAMNTSLAARSQRGQLENMFKSLLPSYQAEVQRSVEYMAQVGKELVQHRRDHPTDKHDLLNAMIYGKDPKTGKMMRDELIAANMQTFLVAGHETTSGLLSFAFLYLLLNPSTFFAAQQEVDQVVGKDRIQPKHLKDLKYINAVLRETLRLTPTAPAFGRGVRPENREEHPTIGKGKYEIPRGMLIVCLLSKIQRDPKIWGDDADDFKPERMLDENFDKMPKNAWKPFGTGLRACIGRPFAWQEALMVAAMLLQNLDMALDDPNYQMQMQQSLTIKPKDCYIRVKLRPGISATALQERLSGSSIIPLTTDKDGIGKIHDDLEDEEEPLTILFGSNTGTCQALAQKLASEAGEHGYKPSVKDMDHAIGGLPKSGPVVVITASYEGQPPDNAARFVAWLESLKEGDSMRGVHYTVFGFGHNDWSATYQRVPTLVDDLLQRHGAARFAERGASDASQRDMFGDFDKWLADKLWPALSSREKTNKPSPAKPKMPVVALDISTQQRASHLQQNAQWTIVTKARTLTAPGEPEKGHIEFQLPSDVSYRAGDYLAVLPLNPDESIKRVINRFNLPWDAVITIKKGESTTTLPTDTPISVYDLLRGYVEILQPATRKDLDLLVETVEDEKERKKLVSLTGEKEFSTRILGQRTSILDLLEEIPSSTLPFASFLALLPPLRARHYSISSSPLANPTTCSLTYSVIDMPTWADPTKRFLGVAGTYLQSLRVGDRALVSVRATNKFFRLPPDPEATPLLMFCAGAGLAPFRGFLQERAVLICEGGRKLAPAIIFIGCRSATADRLYADEIDAWARAGVVDVRYTFSRESSHELARGCTRAYERMLLDRADVFRLWEEGAKVYTCGSAELLRDLGQAARGMILERARAVKGPQVTEEEVDAWMKERNNDRFVSDVFS